MTTLIWKGSELWIYLTSYLMYPFSPPERLMTIDGIHLYIRRGTSDRPTMFGREASSEGGRVCQPSDRGCTSTRTPTALWGSFRSIHHWSGAVVAHLTSWLTRRSTVI